MARGPCGRRSDEPREWAVEAQDSVSARGHCGVSPVQQSMAGDVCVLAPWCSAQVSPTQVPCSSALCWTCNSASQEHMFHCGSQAMRASWGCSAGPVPPTDSPSFQVRDSRLALIPGSPGPKQARKSTSTLAAPAWLPASETLGAGAGQPQGQEQTGKTGDSRATPTGTLSGHRGHHVLGTRRPSSFPVAPLQLHSKADSWVLARLQGWVAQGLGVRTSTEYPSCVKCTLYPLRRQAHTVVTFMPKAEF